MALDEKLISPEDFDSRIEGSTPKVVEKLSPTIKSKPAENSTMVIPYNNVYKTPLYGKVRRGFRNFFSTGGREARALWREMGRSGSTPSFVDYTLNISIIIPAAATYLKRWQHQKEAGKPINIWRQTGQKPLVEAVIEDPTLLPRYLGLINNRSRRQHRKKKHGVGEKLTERVVDSSTSLSSRTRNAYQYLSGRLSDSVRYSETRLEASGTKFQNYMSQLSARASSTIPSYIPIHTAKKYAKAVMSHNYRGTLSSIVKSAQEGLQAARSHIPTDKVQEYAKEALSYDYRGRFNAAKIMGEKTSQAMRAKWLTPNYGRRLALGAIALATTMSPRGDHAANHMDENLQNTNPAATIEHQTAKQPATTIAQNNQTNIDARVESHNNVSAPDAPQNAPPINRADVKYIPTMHKVEEGQNLSRIVQRYIFGSPSFNSIVRQYATDNQLQSPYKVAKKDTPVRIAIKDGRETRYVETVVLAGTDYATPVRKLIAKVVKENAEYNKLVNPDKIFPHDKLEIKGHYSLDNSLASNEQGGNKFELHGANNPHLSYDSGSDSFTLKVPARNTSLQIGNERRNGTIDSAVVQSHSTRTDLESLNSRVYDGSLFERIGERHTANLGKHEDAQEIKYERATIFKGLFAEKSQPQVYAGDLFGNVGKKQTANLGNSQENEKAIHNQARIFEEPISGKPEAATASVYNGQLFERVGEKQTISLGKHEQQQETAKYQPREMFADVVEGRKTIIPQAGGLTEKLKDSAKGFMGRIGGFFKKDYQALTLTPWLDRISGAPVYSI